MLETDDDNGSLGANSSSIAGRRDPRGRHVLPAGRTRSAATADRSGPTTCCSTSSRARRPRRSSRTTTGNRAAPGDERFVSGTNGPNEHDLYAIELGAGDTVFLSLDLDPERDGDSFNGRLAFGNGDRCWSVNDNGALGCDPVGGLRRHRRRAPATYYAAGRLSRRRRASGDLPALGHRDPRGRAQLPDLRDHAVAGRDRRPGRHDLPDRRGRRRDDRPRGGPRSTSTHSFMADLDATLEAPAGNRDRPVRRHRLARPSAAPTPGCWRCSTTTPARRRYTRWLKGIGAAARVLSAPELVRRASRRPGRGSSRSATTRSRTSGRSRGRT